ncbi:MAG TPA: ATP-binding cassette domain-containing protein [Bacteroidales bacterium]|nr:ATP-binding cassette domain-containing protein [Bacteroidales bacterium]HQK37137.1 ATP-binding cassette domain-containing protein [Bacteroidales bacterium]
MSEEILKALMQLFGIIAKQDEGIASDELNFIREFLSRQLSHEKVNEYFHLFEKIAEIPSYDSDKKDISARQYRLTSVRDSVKILSICRKINKTLTREQKIIVLIRLFELININKRYSAQRMAIINTVAEVFNISTDEFESIRRFAALPSPTVHPDPNLVIIGSSAPGPDQITFISRESVSGEVFILRIPSVDLYFLKYSGKDLVTLNGMEVFPDRIYLFASGSALRFPKSKPVYYSDVSSRFQPLIPGQQILFEARNISFRFPNGEFGLRDISFAEPQGRLIGIMGASGAGKTTLLNVLSGIEKPFQGEIYINGLDLHKRKKELEGIIGVIPQDDLLIEELTVFQNLWFAACQCFRNKSTDEITALTNQVLKNLGLLEYSHLKVGSVLNREISGGQRKRLNIALELIREPSVLFVDEPTSGLSSRDSENVMDLLRELSQKGKLVFVVIHQPSSEIFKMFDKILILDTGGYLVYYGNPVESVMYFKRLDKQINSEIGECPLCGNVNPEQIFSIIEAEVVNEYGQYTGKRKVSPEQWHQLYLENIAPESLPPVSEPPPRILAVPSWFRQFSIYLKRDIIAKLHNKQYIALNLIETPALALLLSFLIRYIANPGSSTYIYRENENIPIYIFMILIVAVFLGLTLSAEEIFHDRKILKREQFLHLSRSSYLMSKIFILLAISALQAIVFILIGNNMLSIREMTFYYWLAFFVTAACSNLMGLIVSSSFNSVVTIYIMIPLLIIPMMVLSGAMFPFDKLNRLITRVDKTPLLAEFMPTKWSYEALMVHQYKDNRYQQYFYPLEKEISHADFMQGYYIPELRKRLDRAENQEISIKDSSGINSDLLLVSNEIRKQIRLTPDVRFPAPSLPSPEKFTDDMLKAARQYFDSLDSFYNRIFLKYNAMKENLVSLMLARNRERYYYLYDSYFNESVSDQVRKIFEKKKILEYEHHLYQQFDPVYRDPEPSGPLDFRSHFFAPRKYFAGFLIDTYWFNVLFIVCYGLLLYAILYFDLLLKLLNRISSLRKKRKNLLSLR